MANCEFHNQMVNLHFPMGFPMVFLWFPSLFTRWSLQTWTLRRHLQSIRTNTALVTGSIQVAWGILGDRKPMICWNELEGPMCIIHTILHILYIMYIMNCMYEITYMYIYIYIYIMYVCMCIYIYVHMYIYICTYVYIYTYMWVSYMVVKTSFQVASHLPV